MLPNGTRPGAQRAVDHVAAWQGTWRIEFNQRASVRARTAAGLRPLAPARECRLGMGRCPSALQAVGELWRRRCDAPGKGRTAQRLGLGCSARDCRSLGRGGRERRLSGQSRLQRSNAGRRGPFPADAQERAALLVGGCVSQAGHASCQPQRPDGMPGPGAGLRRAPRDRCQGAAQGAGHDHSGRSRGRSRSRCRRLPADSHGFGHRRCRRDSRARNQGCGGFAWRREEPSGPPSGPPGLQDEPFDHQHRDQQFRKAMPDSVTLCGNAFRPDDNGSEPRHGIPEDAT